MDVSDVEIVDVVENVGVEGNDTTAALVVAIKGSGGSAVGCDSPTTGDAAAFSAVSARITLMLLSNKSS